MRSRLEDQEHHLERVRSDEVVESRYEIVAQNLAGPDGTSANGAGCQDMPRFLFHTSDLDSAPLHPEDWLEFPDVEAACLAAEVALREMAAEGDLGPTVSVLTVFDNRGVVVHRTELEVRTVPCSDAQGRGPAES